MKGPPCGVVSIKGIFLKRIKLSIPKRQGLPCKILIFFGWFILKQQRAPLYLKLITIAKGILPIHRDTKDSKLLNI